MAWAAANTPAGFVVSDPPAPKKESNERETAAHYFWEAVLKLNSIASGIIALLLGIGVSLLTDKPVPGWIAYPAFIVLLLLSAALAQALRTAVKDGDDKRQKLITKLTANQAMLRVAELLPPFPPYTHAVCMCLVETEHRLQENSHVTFVVKLGEVERPLGSGTVRTRQENGKTQITLDDVHDQNDPEVELVRENKGDIKSRLFVARHYVPLHGSHGAALPAPTPEQVPGLGPSVVPALNPKERPE